MPFVVTCPTCGKPMTVNESPVGYVVHCPACRSPLTVPAAAPPAEETLPEFTAEEPPRRRYKPGHPPLLVPVAVVLLVAALVGGGGWIIWANREPQKRDEPVAKAEPQKPTEKGPQPKAEGVPKEIEGPAIKPKSSSFADAWAEARELARGPDEEEPALTDRAKKLLTPAELQQAEIAMFNFGFGFTEDAAPRLVRMGLGAWVARQSRSRAVVDDRFKSLMGRLWEPATGGKGLLEAMNVWARFGQRTQLDVIAAVAEGPDVVKLRPATRDAVLLLGGAAWLAR